MSTNQLCTRQTNYVTALSILAKSYQPRPYQHECMTALAEAREQGIKKGLVVMASGLGKTLTTIFDLQQFFATCPDARILYICHQESILLQSKAKFQQVFGQEYSYGMFTGNYKTMRAVDFLFATFQTMRDYREEFPPDAFDYIIVDEAHHTPAETYQPTVDYFTPQFLLGLTATKNRGDGQDLLEIYDQILYQMDIFDGWAEGWLARVDYRIMLDDLNEAEFQKYIDPESNIGKVSITQLNRTIFAPMHDQGIVASIREQTADLDNPQIFVFCSSIDHANVMAKLFGGEAAVIHSKQSYSQNQAILENFHAGKIRIIISVNMLNEGVDAPEADTVVFLRSTEVESIFFQQLGRGLRIIGNKRTVRVLDYVANLERIATILEMEETAKKRIQANPNYSDIGTLAPIIINIPATKFTVRRVDVEHILAIMTKVEYSDEDLLSMLQNAANQQGGTIRSNDLRLYELPSLDLYIKRFGSWNRALELANLPVNMRRGSWTKQSIIVALQQKAKELGHTPSAKELNQDLTMPSPSACTRQFGTWSAAIQAAGLAAIRKYSYDRTELLTALRQKAQELGRAPRQRDMLGDPRMPSVGAYIRIFGDWESALAALGHKPRKPGEYTDNELIATLQQKAQELGRNPVATELWKHPDMPHYSTYVNHFGSWKNALIAAGLPLVGIDLTDDELIVLLQQKAKQLGRTPGRREIDSDQNMPSSSLYKKHFGSWQGAVEKAGLQPTRVKRTDRGDLTPEKAIKILQNKAKQLGRTPSKTDLDQDPSLPSATVIARRFGSWNDAITAAGLQPIQIKKK